MRFLFVLALLLSGCGPGQFFSPEQIEERALANRNLRAYEADREARFRSSPEGQATLGCQFRTNAAMQGWRSRSFLDLEGTARGNMLMEQCMAYWRQTGQLP